MRKRQANHQRKNKVVTAPVKEPHTAFTASLLTNFEIIQANRPCTKPNIAPKMGAIISINSRGWFSASAGICGICSGSYPDD